MRDQGKGKVFYTAYGHDERTWNNPAFQDLVERAVVWSVPEAARQAHRQLTMPAVTYVDGMNVPNYENRNPAPKYQLPFTVDEAMKFIQIPAEFSLTLFATEPDIVKPIAFAFDERGRMWILETVDYPNKPTAGKPGSDRIRILEDTNGDGKADKFTVFADQLNIPTSLVFANGGVIVAQPPHILFLKDTNGDDKADERKILSTGWGQSDTHATLSNLQYGIDNYIWGVVGYSGFKGEINGKQLAFGQAAFRFRPDGSDFEVMTGSTNNTWGLGFSETFDVFGSTANNDPSWNMAIPNRFFDGVEGLPTPGQRGVGSGYQSIAAFYAVHPLTPYIRQVDVFNGYTAGAGHYLYTARSFPKEYWNRIAFINEPTAHLIGQGIMEKQGAGFVARDGWNLAAGAEEWFAPVHTQVGPDGAVWFADWYNFIIQHNPTPQGFSNGPGNAYESQLRDHQRGRIYRVAYKNAAPSPKRSLSLTDTAGLLGALGSDNMFWRLTAQRLLIERGQKDVVPQLQALVKNTSVDAVGINGGAMHALWTLKGLGELDAATGSSYAVAVAALKHPAAGVRKAAAMVLPKTAASASAMLAANVLQDPDLHTRLAATLVLAEMPESAEIAQALYRESQKTENYSDKWLSRAFYIAALRHKTAVHDGLQGRQGGAAIRLAAGRAAARRAQAGLASAEREGDCGRLEGHAGARQLGVARPARLRRRRLVHAHDRRAGGGGDRHADALAGPDAQHRRGLGERPLDDAACRRARRRARRHAAVVRPPGRHAQAGPEPDHRPHPECAQRRWLHGDAGADVSSRVAAARRQSPGRGSTASSARPTPARSTRSRANWRRTWRSPPAVDSRARRARRSSRSRRRRLIWCCA